MFLHQQNVFDSIQAIFSFKQFSWTIPFYAVLKNQTPTPKSLQFSLCTVDHFTFLSTLWQIHTYVARFSFHRWNWFHSKYLHPSFHTTLTSLMLSSNAFCLKLVSPLKWISSVHVLSIVIKLNKTQSSNPLSLSLRSLTCLRSSSVSLLSYAASFEGDHPVLWNFETISEMLLLAIQSSFAITRWIRFLAIFTIFIIARISINEKMQEFDVRLRKNKPRFEKIFIF